jgi:hypothetical protein
MCKVGIIDYSVGCEEAEVVRGKGGRGEELEEEKRKGEKMEIDEKEKTGQKGKCSNRGLSKLVLGQNGEGS